jgi:hypothetical protein
LIGNTSRKDESGNLLASLTHRYRPLECAIGGIQAGIGDETHSRGRYLQGLGAQRHHILMQFLIEATTVSLLGGLIGLVLGS